MFDTQKAKRRVLDNLALIKPHYDNIEDGIDPNMIALAHQGLQSNGKKDKPKFLAIGLESVLNKLSKITDLNHIHLIYQLDDGFYKLPIEDFQKEASPI